MIDYINNKKVARIKLYVLHSLMAFIAITGGVGLILTNGLGMDIAILQTSPFSSFMIPGLILAIIVGGTSLCAALLLVQRSTYAAVASAVASFGLLIWVFGEMYTTHVVQTKQIVSFSWAIIELILLLIVMGVLDLDRKLPA